MHSQCGYVYIFYSPSDLSTLGKTNLISTERAGIGQMDECCVVVRTGSPERQSHCGPLFIDDASQDEEEMDASSNLTLFQSDDFHVLHNTYRIF